MITKYTLFLAVALALAGAATLVATPSDAMAQQCDCPRQPADAPAVAEQPTSTLPDDEVAGLLWMREEEKLAHDVYVALYDMWGTSIFNSISRAESTHMQTVGSLLDTYGIADPADDNGPGEFTEPIIQGLYTQLVADGSKSLTNALEVGAYIEELDILDLQERASAYSDIQRVYDNLERGSRNHLRAFVGNLARRGVDYTSALMDEAQFEAIVGTTTQAGNRGDANGRNGDSTPLATRRGRRGAGRFGS